jgi:hypothetical protein
MTVFGFGVAQIGLLAAALARSDGLEDVWQE